MSTDLVRAARTDLEQLRSTGALAAARQEALTDMVQQIRGAEWGSGNSVIEGAAFSEATALSFARFCVVTRANPRLHVDLLGGKPYLNAEYWKDRCASDPAFLGDEQINVSPGEADKCRRRATELRAAAEGAEGERAGALRGKALELEMAAEEIEDLRAKYHVPEWAKVAYVTRIRRFANSAPMDKIRRGEIEVADWMILTEEEANWAGGKPEVAKRNGQGTYQSDPVGEAEPEKTARTRSYRRCGRKAFSAWMDEYERTIHEAERIIEAEFEIVQGDRAAARARLPQNGGPRALTSGAGEPTEVRPTDVSRELPTEDVAPPVARAAPQPDPEPEGDAEAFDVKDARGKYFALLKECGIAMDQRKRWQVDHGLDESTKVWEPADWLRAHAILEQQRDVLREAESWQPEDGGTADAPQDDEAPAEPEPTPEGDPEPEPAPEGAGAPEDDADDAGDTTFDEPEPWDREAATATLKKVLGFAGYADRTSWRTFTSRNDLPDAFSTWDREHFDRAEAPLMRALRGNLNIEARKVGRSAADIRAEVLGVADAEPHDLEAFVRCFDRVREIAAEAAE